VSRFTAKTFFAKILITRGKRQTLIILHIHLAMSGESVYGTLLPCKCFCARFDKRKTFWRAGFMSHNNVEAARVEKPKISERTITDVRLDSPEATMANHISS
jgi:hypothetical protein